MLWWRGVLAYRLRFSPSYACTDYRQLVVAKVTMSLWTSGENAKQNSSLQNSSQKAWQELSMLGKMRSIPENAMGNVLWYATRLTCTISLPGFNALLVAYRILSMRTRSRRVASLWTRPWSGRGHGSRTMGNNRNDSIVLCCFKKNYDGCASCYCP